MSQDDVEEFERLAAQAKPSENKTPRLVADVPGPDWIELDETMRLTKAKSPTTVINARTIIGNRRPPGQRKKTRNTKEARKKRGFKCATKLLPLHAKVFRLPQTMYLKRSGKTVTRLRPHVLYYKPHAEVIGEEDWQYETRADDFYINPLDPKPKDENERPKRYLYTSTVRKNYGWRDTTLTKWRVFCPALGRAIKYLEPASRYSHRENEFVYLESDLDLIKAAIGGTNWKRKAKGKLQTRTRGEHGRLLPLAPAASNGNGHAPHPSGQAVVAKPGGATDDPYAPYALARYFVKRDISGDTLRQARGRGQLPAIRNAKNTQWLYSVPRAREMWADKFEAWEESRSNRLQRTVTKA